jgi:hypothetical protein
MNESIRAVIERLNRASRRSKPEESVQGGRAVLAAAGLTEDRLERIAHDIGTDVEKLALAVATCVPFRLTPTVTQVAEDTFSTRVAEQNGDEKSADITVPRSEDVNIVAQVAHALTRIADHFDPPPPDIVGTPYVARKLGCTTVWVTDMIRSGKIPKSCVVPGSGNGRPWKLYRRHIEKWIETR